MAGLVALIAEPQNWPASALILLITSVLIVLSPVLDRPKLARGAGLTAKGWPVLGARAFFTKRHEFFKTNAAKSPNGHFNFYYGPHSVVALSGKAAKHSYYWTRDLHFSEGFRALFQGGPNTRDSLGYDESERILAMMRRLLGKEHIKRALPKMNADIAAAIAATDASAPLDTFAAVHRLILKLTQRTTGSTDIADNAETTERLLGMYDSLDTTSANEVMFPWLPNSKRKAKARVTVDLYNLIVKVVEERRDAGRREDDTMQHLIDTGESNLFIASFIMGSLFAGLITSSGQAGWVLTYLSHNPEILAEIRTIVDAVLAKHRASPDESPADILKKLAIEDWENEFTIIRNCIRESIRTRVIGTSFRKNVSGKDIKLEDGIVVPDGACAVYNWQDTHFDENIYSNPYTWDPHRYSEERAEGKNIPDSFLGWGNGLHPCLGKKFAELEISMITVYMIAHFDFTACGKDLNSPAGDMIPVRYNDPIPQRPVGECFLKLTPRC